MTHPRVLVNGALADAVSAMDRGLAYGDGLFETIRFVGGVAPFWAAHMDRLSRGCVRLRLPLPDIDALTRDASIVVGALAHAVVRITVTRGVGERGYAFPVMPRPTRVVAAFDAPAMSGDAYATGVRVRWCALRLAHQPLLAGLKHLNRLEQVMARAEWSDPAVGEGLLCDSEGRVVGGTMTNLFAVIDGTLVTPALDQCGVAGVARGMVLSCREDARVTAVWPADLAHASEVFLSSSVRGILPVQAVGDTVYGPGPITRALQHRWREWGFPMEQA